MMEVICVHRWGVWIDVPVDLEAGEAKKLRICKWCGVVNGEEERDPRVVIGRVERL